MLTAVELVHASIFRVTDGEKQIVSENLEYSALRIEKRHSRIRLLFASGSTENPSFKEIFQGELAFVPRYIGIFSLKGFVAEAGEIPVRVDHFRLEREDCNLPGH